MESGEERGVLDTREALALAAGLGLDLVEIDDDVPPACRVMDYGAYRRQSRPGAVSAEVIVRLRAADGDIARHVARVRRLLAAGTTCKVAVVLRPRELAATDAARAIIDRITGAVAEHGSVDGPPGYVGRRYVALLVPAATASD